MPSVNKKAKSFGYDLPKVEITIPEKEGVETVVPPPVIPARESGSEIREVTRVIPLSQRRRLPSERQAIVHKFAIDTTEGYLTVGLYEDGTPGEIFVRLQRASSTIDGLLDSFCITFSLALQYGIPLEILASKLSKQTFEPSGTTQNPNIPSAESITDYVCRWLALRFLNKESMTFAGLEEIANVSNEQLHLTQPASTQNSQSTER